MNSEMGDVKLLVSWYRNGTNFNDDKEMLPSTKVHTVFSDGYRDDNEYSQLLVAKFVIVFTKDVPKYLM